MPVLPTMAGVPLTGIKAKVELLPTGDPAIAIKLPDYKYEKCQPAGNLAKGQTASQVALLYSLLLNH